MEYIIRGHRPGNSETILLCKDIPSIEYWITDLFYLACPNLKIFPGRKEEPENYSVEITISKEGFNNILINTLYRDYDGRI